MSIFDKIVMLDEAQNTTNHMIKSLVTRINDTSKLIVVGDIEQIDDKNLNKYNNGLVHLIEAGKDEEFIGHICMDIDRKSRRGKLSEFGSKKL
jgi:PhoH-like ATPase